jgi:hypothetical protein
MEISCQIKTLMNPGDSDALHSNQQGYFVIPAKAGILQRRDSGLRRNDWYKGETIVHCNNFR